MTTLCSVFLLVLWTSLGHVTGQDRECGQDQYKCGDVCVSEYTFCSCGNVTLSKYCPSYCCLDPGDTCTYDYYYDYDRIDSDGDAYNPVCSRGQPVQRSETCNGACPVDSPSSTTDAQGHTTCDCPEEDGWQKCDGKCGYKWQCTGQCDPDQYKCGDVCVGRWSPCSCGGVILTKYNPSYCCLDLGDKCTYDYIDSENGDDAENTVCSRGKPVPVPCRGVEAGHCSNMPVTPDCDETLECQGGEVNRYNITTAAVQGHYYCSYDAWLETREYENIDRTDEYITDTSTRKSTSSALNTRLSSLLRNCTRYGDPGHYCGTTCIPNFEWCRSLWVSTCVEVAGPSNETISFQSNDPELCSDMLFWQTQDCKWYRSSGKWYGSVQVYGIHCSRAMHRCILPWYTREPGAYYLDRWAEVWQTCDDHSLQVWPLHSACPNSSYYLHKLKTSFPGEDFSDVEQELSDNYQLAEDPHNCWDSCSAPEPNCLACTNEAYLRCEKSGEKICIHPDLRCDGVPHCSLGEDEDLDDCRNDYANKKIISSFATYRCRRADYPGRFLEK